jgi:hypothetical protein
MTVALSTNTKLLWIPAVATIPEGEPLAVFLVVSGNITQNETVTITASINSSSATASLNLTQ